MGDFMTDGFAAFIGLDWADAKHDCHLISSDGQQWADDFEQDPQAIAAQIESWRKRFPGACFAVAIEATKGAIINALLEYPDLQIYPVNPAALASYRKAWIEASDLASCTACGTESPNRTFGW